MRLLRLLIILVAFGGTPGVCCTIFVLTDDNRTLFFNNEDWSNPATRLWFVPAGQDHLGCAYLGFDDGWAQGGVNTAGLAFDWVAGAEEAYTPAEDLRRVRGNSSQRMLETCTTVDEAIAFYRTHRETEFARARILIADRRGASVIVGAKDGALHFDHDTRSRGFGYGWRILEQRLASPPEPTLATGAAVLRACIQVGATPTQYSNVFDLRSGEIFVYPEPQRDEPVRLELQAELAKGGHSYDIPQLRAQIAQAPRPLANEQKRFYLDEFSPLEPAEPAVASQIAHVLRTAAKGSLRAADFTPEFWAQLAPATADMQAQVAQLGELRHVALVARSAEADRPVYRCIVEFSGARVLQRYEFDRDGRIAAIASEFVESVLP